uniref:Golgi-associated, gamma adaptin ear containing, ARF binding protein 1 n=1 Tax=Oryzias sinensis TaxID=183150 RepID=A0A8C7ZJ98_9TELE
MIMIKAHTPCFSSADKGTSPLNKETDWSSIKAFCDELDQNQDGPQLASRLLAHKIQSPQEWEAMQALTALETCVKNCGKRFHTEVGKFRFLNELIKVVSPKYLGCRAPEPVKKKILEMMYSWTVRLPEETKIAEAYQMLKKQGIVKQDPVLPDDEPLPPPPPRTKSAIFDDEEKSKVRRRIFFFQDEKRVEKVSKRVNAIQEVKESVSLLSQLLEGYGMESCSQSNQELIKDLYQRCEKMRPTLFRLASDTEDNDEALADILQANDSLTQVINLYRQLVNGEEVTKDDSKPSSSSALLDLTGLNLSGKSEASNAEPFGYSNNVGLCLLDDELMSLGKKTPSDVLKRLAMLGWALSASTSHSFGSLFRDKLQPQSKVLLRDLGTKSSLTTRPAAPTSSPAVHSEKPYTSLVSNPAEEGSSSAADLYDNISLAEVTVPLESIHPSSLLPVTVFDKNSLRVLFTFARDCPPLRPDVLVVIISMLSSAPVPVTNIRFQAAVPKVMKVKLQPPSSSELPAFNPLLPPAAITQILLLANPHKEKVRLRYKLTFNLGGKSHDESGDVDQFPPPNTWGNL